MTMPPPPPTPPQQPYPANPYGAAAPPYPHPQPYPWGGPPVPPPRRGLGPGAITAIVLGSIAGVVCLGLLATVLLAHSDDTSSPRYRLTVPKSLLHGRYTLDEDMSQTLADHLGSRSGPNERHMKAAAGKYSSSGDPQLLLASGLYGQIRNPKRALASMLKGMSEADGAHINTAPRELTPSGTEEPITCEVLGYTRYGAPGTLTVCGWSDHSTVATVSSPDSHHPDLQAAAKRAADVRNEMRVPLQ
ncbi:hypothetical protein [Streptomyces orinoci]|uniref:Uncharacterized protein n=1 Tax=Streptomyces orinoci TaxID=67339 RepID=A0ABV3K7H9_STRON|nr:hypothetical protein [Streptomyces orinoci]